MKITKLLLFCVLFVFFAMPASAAQATQTEKVRILFSSNLHGQTTACG